MDLQILLNQKISKYYFFYQIYKCIDQNGAFDTEKYKYKFNPYSESFAKELSDFFTTNKNYFDYYKKQSLENSIEYLAFSIKNNIQTLNDLESIYFSEFEKSKDTLTNQKNITESQLNDIKAFLKKVLNLYSVNKNQINKIEIFLNIGGHKEFVSGLALPKDSINNTIFINCEKAEDVKYINNTIIHEVSHLIENFSKKTELAKTVFNNRKELASKYKPVQKWKAFINEIIITAIAGKKFSIYLNENYIPTEIKGENDLINIIAYNSKQLVLGYLVNNKELDTEFYVQLFKIIENQLHLL